MRQSPLLSLCLGGLLGTIAACSSNEGLQPIAQKSATASDGTGGAVATGGRTGHGGTDSAAGTFPGGRGGVAGESEENSGGVSTDVNAGSAGEGGISGSSGTSTGDSGSGGEAGTAGSGNSSGKAGSDTSGGTAGSDTSGGTAGSDTSGGTAGSSTSGGTAGSSNSAGTSGSENSGGSAGSGGSSGTEGSCKIEADTDGWVSSDSNDCGIQGYWYSYSDCTTSPDDCTENLLPAEGYPFIPDGIRMCTSATTAIVDSAEELDAKWGVGIGLSLNQPPAGAPRENIGSLAVNLVGFTFDIVGTLIPGELRVNFPTPATERIEHLTTITSSAGHYEVYFSELAQGSWVENPSPLDPAEITAIQFHIPTQVDTQTTFDYCIENLYGLYSD